MLSEAQYLEKIANIQKVVTLFLNGKKTIMEIANETGISKSSVQRYLNDVAYIRQIYGEDANFIIEEIQRKLAENKEEGNKLGGIVFATNNDATKDNMGHFTGSKKK